MRRALEKWLEPRATTSAALIRAMVGAVFLSEGIQKFLFPDELGAGRFAKIGIPWPELLGPFVGVVETVCGAMILLGLLTRLAAVPLIINMIVAIVSTKIPILLGESFWGFAVRDLPRHGFWSMAHEMRTDWAMLLGSLFLLVAGPDRYTVDATLHRRLSST
jgi:putative oxidoreductase